MLDLDIQCPETEDIEEAINRCFASIRDNIADIEMLVKRLASNQTFITSEKAAQILHCAENAIPDRVIRYHVGRNYLYKVKDIYDYIELKKVGGK